MPKSLGAGARGTDGPETHLLRCLAEHKDLREDIEAMPAGSHG